MTEPVVKARPLCLVTRPQHQSKQLSEMLDKAGFEVISFPTIVIQYASPTPFLEQLAQSINDYDLLLFVSRNAVDGAFQYLDAEKFDTRLQLGVIGKGTLQALRAQGVESQVVPADSYNSEGLLASAVLHQVEGKRVLIFRGQQGRNLLGDTLAERGARVEYCEVYQRVLPDYDKNVFQSLVARAFPQLAIFTSAEGLQNCFQLLHPQDARQLRTIPWLLISERMRETARHLRHNAEIIIANSASDEGIVQALMQWHQTKR